MLSFWYGSHANITHFHKKGCALGLILKVRVFGTRKWPNLVCTWRHGGHVGGQEWKHFSLKNLFSCKFFEKELYCFDPQHGRLFTWLQTKNTKSNYLNYIVLLFIKYRKIPKISPRAYIFQRPFLRGLFLEGLIFGGAYLRREICVSKSIGLALLLEVNLPFLLCFTLYLWAIFQVQAPGGLIFGGAV